MIDSLNELNRLLIAIDELSHSDSGALKSSVITLCQNQVIEGKFPNHNDTILFSEENGIVYERNERLVVTDLGKEILKLNAERKYELNNLQKDLLVRKLFLEGSMKLSVLNILMKFSPAYASRTFEWSSVDNSPLEGQLELLELLKQAGLIIGSNLKLSVDSRYVDFVRELRKGTDVTSPEELFKRLKNAEICGAIAETIVFDLERQRLNELNCLTEAECIQKISDLNVSAGYDIASFDGPSYTLMPDRLIEVKGSTDTRIQFYWSKNEIMQAKKLGQKYWIYFVGGIDIEKKSSSQEPIMIQDPIKSILTNKAFEIDCMEYFVKKV